MYPPVKIKYFKNKNPIYLEIGTGKCKFIYEMAKKNPDINFIGIERIDTVLAYGVRELEKLEEEIDWTIKWE